MVLGSLSLVRRSKSRFGESVKWFWPGLWLNLKGPPHPRPKSLSPLFGAPEFIFKHGKEEMRMLPFSSEHLLPHLETHSGLAENRSQVNLLRLEEPSHREAVTYSERYNKGTEPGIKLSTLLVLCH